MHRRAAAHAEKRENMMQRARYVPEAPPGSAGVGEINAAGSTLLSTPPNPNAALNRFVVATDPGGKAFDSVSWSDAARSSVSWDSVSWSDASSSDVSWTDVSWADVSWSAVSWTDVSWSDVLAAADVSWEDKAEGETTAPEGDYVLTPEEEAAAEADPTLTPPELLPPVETAPVAPPPTETTPTVPAETVPLP